MLSLGSLGQFRRPGFGSAGPDLRSQGSSGKERLLRCAPGRLLIASYARSGRVPLPPVLPEVANRPPIIAPSSPTRLGNRNPSPPRSMIAGAQHLSESSGGEFDRAIPLKVPDRELFGALGRLWNTNSLTGTFQLPAYRTRNRLPIGNMDIVDSKALGETVRLARKRLKVTQKDLALVSGTGLRFIIELEQGKPTCQLGKALGILQALGLRLKVVES